MHHAQFTLLIKEFGEKLGLANLQPDQEGGLTFNFDNQITVDIELNPQTSEIVVFCPVIQFASEVPAAVKDMLLDADFFFQGTGGATLGLKMEEKIVVLAQQFSLSMLTASDLIESSGRIASEALQWRKKLEKIEEESASDTRATSASRPAENAVQR